MVIDRAAGTLLDKTFIDLPEFLTSRDLIVFNDTKVIPARLFGELSGSGGSVEILLLTPIHDNTWRILGRPLKKFTAGKIINLSDELSAEVVSRDEDTAVVRFKTSSSASVSELLHKVGIMPIPPYIRAGHSDDQDKEDYQTPFARVEGSVAAPTASLHFSEELRAKINEQGIKTATITLHLNTASFQPLLNKETQEIKPPPSERIIIPDGIKEAISRTKACGGRVVAVGTSMVRSLESLDLPEIEARESTDLFIKPGHQFKVVDVVVTNFHQPGTSHLMLVEAFLGRDLLQKSYQHALASNYRFLSYGDGMVLF